MVWASLPSFFALSLVGLPVCFADVSLILPGVPPQPLSADIVGVGGNGDTTYLLFQGQPTGVWASLPPQFTGTVTLIEGSGNMELEYVDMQYTETNIESCTFAYGMAGCIQGAAAGSLAETVTVEPGSVMPMLVQGGTASQVSTGTTSSEASVQTIPVPGSSASGSVTATQSAAPSNPFKSASSGVTLTPAKMVGLVGILATWTILV